MPPYSRVEYRVHDALVRRSVASPVRLAEVVGRARGGRAVRWVVWRCYASLVAAHRRLSTGVAPPPSFPFSSQSPS